MNGRQSRNKGARGQAVAAAMLADRDWVVDQITAGIAAGDLMATDPDGRVWCVEVKNCAGILPAHKRQAMEQAHKRKARWMLMSKISGSRSWLVQGQGRIPTTWNEKGGE